MFPISGVLVLISCILYPLGWRSNYEVAQICGDSTSILSLGMFSIIFVLLGCIDWDIMAQWCTLSFALPRSGISCTSSYLGRCHVGWAFVLTCAGGLLSLLSTTIPALLMRNTCNAVGRQMEFANRRNSEPFSQTLIKGNCRSSFSSFSSVNDERKYALR